MVVVDVDNQTEFFRLLQGENASNARDEREVMISLFWLQVGLVPVRSDIVTQQYMASSRSEQNTAGARVKQAPALLHSHL